MLKNQEKNEVTGANAKTVYHYSLAFKLQVLDQIERGVYSQKQAAIIYGCSATAIHKWIKRYGKNHLLNKVVKVSTMQERDDFKALKAQVAELKAALADAHMDHKLDSLFLELACKELGVELDTFKKKVPTSALGKPKSGR